MTCRLLEEEGNRVRASRVGLGLRFTCYRQKEGGTRREWRADLLTSVSVNNRSEREGVETEI